MNLQVGVKVLIKNREGKLLFLRRRGQLSTDRGKTSWDIPGGRIEPDEELMDALRREIHEEIGHDLLADPKLIAAQDIIVSSKNLHVVRLTYLVNEDTGDIMLSDEHDDYRWASLEEAQAFGAEPYLAKVLTDLSTHV